MKRRKQHISWSLVSFILIALFPLQTLAEESRQDKITQLKSQISQVKKELNQKVKSRDKVSDKIAGFDKEIAKFSKQVRKIRAEQQKLAKSMDKLKNRRSELLSNMASNKTQLAGITKTYYVMGNQNYLKSLLNQDDPNKHGRVRTYYNYLNSAYQQKHKTLDQNLGELNRLEQSLIETVSKKRELLKKIEQQTQKIVEKKNQRKVYLTNLDKEIRSDKSQIKRLNDDHKKLEKLAKAIDEIKPKSTIARSSGIAFAKRKGGLRWPVTGKVVHKYGKPRLGGDLKWRGILIETNSGADVRAVSKGQVVFSDWISGFGYVLIIDHNGNYMSLYGHNQQLLKDVGDEVKEDEIVAEAGNSGRSGKPALYFEIRYKGKPVNPAKWIAARDRKRKR